MAEMLRPMPEYVNKIAGWKKSKISNGYVFDLANAKRYYSSIDAEIYIGNTYIDDAVTLQFSVQQNVAPLLGYNSYVADDFVLGARTIQGMLEVNFTGPNYLNQVLSVVAKEAAYELTSYKVERDSRDAAKITDHAANTVSVPDSHAPIWAPSFSLDIMMGKSTKGIEPVHFIITDVQITSMQIGLAPDGTTMTEKYSFIGKDIKTIG